MVGSNCALYGCSTGRTHEFAISKIPVVSAADGEETAAKKKNAREEWLRIILRTREKTPDLKNKLTEIRFSFVSVIFQARMYFDL